MKRFFVLAAVALAVAPMVGCEYDDDDLWSKVDQMQEQIDQNRCGIVSVSGAPNKDSKSFMSSKDVRRTGLRTRSRKVLSTKSGWGKSFQVVSLLPS
jgi:hypothetical protein